MSIDLPLKHIHPAATAAYLSPRSLGLDEQQMTLKPHKIAVEGYLERHLQFLGVVLRGLGEGQDSDAVGSPVNGGASLVLPRVGVQHPPAAHHVCHHVQVPAEVRVAEVGEYGAVAVYLLHEAGEALFGDAHQETLAKVLVPFRVVQGEVDLGVLPYGVAEVPHAEVEVVGQHFPVLLTPQGAPRRRTLRVLCALDVLKVVK